MKVRWILAAVFLLPAIVSGYMTWLMWRAGDDGKWMFGVFALFFLLLAVAPLVPEFKRQPKPEPKPSTSTGFRPHWFMLLAVLAVAVIVVAAIIGAILRRL